MGEMIMDLDGLNVQLAEGYEDVREMLHNESDMK